MYRAHRDYKGQPPPSIDGGNYIVFSVGEQIQVEEQRTAEWWLVSTLLF